MHSTSSLAIRPLLRSPRRWLAAALLLVVVAKAQMIVGTNSEAGQFDQSFGFRGFTFTGVNSFVGRPVDSVSVDISFAKTPDDRFSPPFYQEITFGLLAVDAVTQQFKEVLLVNQFSLGVGADGSSFSGTLKFSDAAAVAVTHDPDNLAPGTFRPVEPLSHLRGTKFDPQLWGLFIEDIQTGAPLAYNSAKLTLDFRPVPEPSTYALWGTLLLVGAVAGRRVRTRFRVGPHS